MCVFNEFPTSSTNFRIIIIPFTHINLLIKFYIKCLCDQASKLRENKLHLLINTLKII